MGFWGEQVESCYAHWKLEIDTQNDGLEEVPPTDYRYLGYPVSILNFSGVSDVYVHVICKIVINCLYIYIYIYTHSCLHRKIV